MNNLVEIDDATFLGEGDGCYTAPYNPPGTPGARDAAWPNRAGVELCGTVEAQVQTPSTKYYSIEAVYQGRSVGMEVKNGTRAQVDQGYAILKGLHDNGTGTINLNGQTYPQKDIDIRVYENGQFLYGTDEPVAAPVPVSAPAPVHTQDIKATAAPTVPPSLMAVGVIAALGAVVGGVYLAYKYMVK